MTFTSAMSERTVLSIATESTIFILINITAIVGNCFVLAAISRNPRLRKIATWYILTLAIADLFAAVTCMPLTVGASIKGEWVYSDVICQIQGYVLHVWGSFSLIIVAATAVHRYFRVVRPVRFRQFLPRHHHLDGYLLLYFVNCCCGGIVFGIRCAISVWTSFSLQSNYSRQEKQKGGCVDIVCGCYSNSFFNIALLLF